jgi:hypothetical protein
MDADYRCKGAELSFYYGSCPVPMVVTVPNCLIDEEINRTMPSDALYIKYGQCGAECVNECPHVMDVDADMEIEPLE